SGRSAAPAPRRFDRRGSALCGDRTCARSRRSTSVVVSSLFVPSCSWLFSKEGGAGYSPAPPRLYERSVDECDEAHRLALMLGVHHDRMPAAQENGLVIR